MITHLRLQNFKTWKDTGPLRMAPVTVFFGGNSSGKSSIGQFLLMLRRTVEQPDRNMVLSTADDQNQNLMHLGGYSEYVFDGKTSRDVAFELGWNCIEQKLLFDRVHRQRSFWKQMEFHARVEQLPDSERVVSKGFDYIAPEPQLPVKSADGLMRYKRLPEIRVGMQRTEAKNKYRLTTQKYAATRSPGRVWSLPHPNRFMAFQRRSIHTTRTFPASPDSNWNSNAS